MEIDKSRLINSSNAVLTMGMFLEHKYDKEQAVYSWSDQDKEVDGKVYPSLKRLYLEYEDVTEYEFAVKYLYSWKQWKRLLKNSVFREMADEWREELELKIRAQAIRDIMDITANDSSFSSAKWLADKGWEKRGAGRPTNAEKEKRLRQDDKLSSEFEDDFKRLKIV